MTRRAWLAWADNQMGGAHEEAAACPMRRWARLLGGDDSPLPGDVESVAATGGIIRPESSGVARRVRADRWMYDYVAAGS